MGSEIEQTSGGALEGTIAPDPRWSGGKPFNELNPAIQAMIIAYLTGNVPHEFFMTDEQLKRAPDLNGSTQVEMIIDGIYDHALLRTKMRVSVLIEGHEAHPNQPFK